MSLKIAFYADDFTGATDTLATLARGGQRTVLFLQPPTEAQLTQVGPLDCVGMAGAARSMSSEAQKAELRRAGAYLAGTRAPVIHYKTCSTFDSSPQVGSIGAAVGLLREQITALGMTVFVGGQPNLGRYCVFSHVFAAYQTGGEVFRLDRHPTMSRHPVTPMTESDLRRHFAAQGLTAISAIHYPAYQKNRQNFDQEVNQAFAKGADGVLFDLSEESQLPLIGRQIWQRAQRQPILAVGPSSVEQALLAYWLDSSAHPPTLTAQKMPDVQMEMDAYEASRVADRVEKLRFTDSTQIAESKDVTQHDGAVLVLSGSLSPLNAKQISQAVSYTRMPILASALLDPTAEAYQMIKKDLAQALEKKKPVLAYLALANELVHDQNESSDIDSAQLAQAMGALLTDLLSSHPIDRLGLAGGDTSSYAIRALDVWGLSYIKPIDSGVALCQLHADQPHLHGLQVMLKGGQMGALDIFEKLLTS